MNCFANSFLKFRERGVGAQQRQSNSCRAPSPAVSPRAIPPFLPAPIRCRARLLSLWAEFFPSKAAARPPRAPCRLHRARKRRFPLGRVTARCGGLAHFRRIGTGIHLRRFGAFHNLFFGGLLGVRLPCGCRNFGYRLRGGAFGGSCRSGNFRGGRVFPACTSLCGRLCAWRARFGCGRAARRSRARSFGHKVFRKVYDRRVCHVQKPLGGDALPARKQQAGTLDRVLTPSSRARVGEPAEFFPSAE